MRNDGRSINGFRRRQNNDGVTSNSAAINGFLSFKTRTKQQGNTSLGILRIKGLRLIDAHYDLITVLKFLIRTLSLFRKA